MLLLAAPLLVTTLILSACVPAAAPDPTSKPTSAASPTSSATSTATADPDASPAPHVETGTRISLSCSDLVSPQQMYDYNPNFGLVDSFVPGSGSLAAQAVAASGLACRWMNQTSGTTIDVSVAHLDAESTSIRKAFLKANSTPVSKFGPDGYFDQGDLRSSGQAFPGDFWVTATSIAFFGADDAAPIMKAATAAVG